MAGLLEDRAEERRVALGVEGARPANGAARPGTRAPWSAPRSVRELRSRSAAVWRSLARERDLVVTSNGKPIALLSVTTASTLEASLAALRQARAQLAVAAMQRRARETGADRLTLEEVNAEIDAVRRSRDG